MESPFFSVLECSRVVLCRGTVVFFRSALLEFLKIFEVTRTVIFLKIKFYYWFFYGSLKFYLTLATTELLLVK